MSAPEQVLPVRVLCRHCPSTLAPGPQGRWLDAGGSTFCEATPPLRHLPLPTGLRGGQRAA